MFGIFDGLIERVTAASRDYYGERLVSLAVFGSVGRRTPRPDSDIDLLIVAEDLPRGRVPRVEEFGAIEARMAQELDAARRAGYPILLSPVFKTPTEVQTGSPLFLDMIDDARIVVDRDEFFARALGRFKARLTELGARRIWRGNAWYWDLKPDYRPGEVFELT
ncbi:MAG: nucleotidyltransferase domain-containing protein [Luteitalea sp.]|nr:nucleotidyltransferase domain-containing protein [Luteitalea sp.]